jgi:hypothetical protein
MGAKCKVLYKAVKNVIFRSLPRWGDIFRLLSVVQKKLHPVAKR